MRAFCLIITGLLALVLLSCNKKKPTVSPVPSPPAGGSTDTGSLCRTLPPSANPAGWIDSIGDENKNINAFLFHPLDPDQIIFVVNGDAFGYNKLFFYHIPTRQARYVCPLGQFLPQVNARGWISFSDVENNVFLIKNNGALIVPLSSGKRSHNPQWDHTGRYIYYFNEAFNSLPSQLIKADTTGAVVEIWPVEQPYFAPFRLSGKLILIETLSEQCQLVLKDFHNTNNNRVLISGPMYIRPGQLNFGNLTLDHTDEHVYWSNSNGIFRCHLASLKIDTVLKNCPSLIFRNPIMAFKDREMTYSQQVLTPLNSLRLYRSYHTMEMNLRTGQSQEIRIYP